MKQNHNKSRVTQTCLFIAGILLLIFGYVLFINGSLKPQTESELLKDAVMGSNKNESESLMTTEINLQTESESEEISTDKAETDGERDPSSEETTESTDGTETQTIYRVRRSWDDSSTQIGAWFNLESAIANCPRGYYVFDEDGNVAYDPESDTSSDKTTLLQVPDAQGADSTFAETRLEADHFVVVIIEEYSDTVPIGYVISQSPAPDTIVEEWSKITLIVSKGRQPVRMISVVGLNHDAARQALEWLGFSVLEVWHNDYSDGIPFGVVVTQSLPEGMELAPGTAVMITISIGPKPTEPSEPPTEPPTQPPTEPPTQPPTEPPTQPPTEPPTQPPTEPPTQPPTEPPTQLPTAPPTEPPTEPAILPPETSTPPNSLETEPYTTDP